MRSGPNISELRAAFHGPHELLKASDGRTLFLRRWPASGPSSVSVLVLHGITAYSGPYGALLGVPLSQAGIDVWGLDLRGHGLSDGRRGDYPGAPRLELDLSEAVARVKAEGRKLVVLGHSLGVLTALLAARGRPDAVDGLVLLSAARQMRTGIYPEPHGKALLKALIGASLLRGTPLIEYRREGMMGLDDPLFNFRYSARFYTTLYGVGVLQLSTMLREGNLDVPILHDPRPLRGPVLVGVGDRDELFPLPAVQHFCNGLPASDKEFFVVPGAKHASFPPGSWGPLTDWLHRKF